MRSARCDGVYNMEYIEKDAMPVFSNPGVISRQILSPANSESRRITITVVHLEPGACQPRHTHASSEQIWYALVGSGTLLLADGAKRRFTSGDAVRFADGDVHGLVNDGNTEFVYLSVTSPPIDFGYAYEKKSK